MNGLSGMVYNGENYYYVKNTLGDIIAIRNSAGTEVASYNYDGWGNVIAKYGTMADINPFRYRGYYYDTETGFYYLQTRYYDPTTRLFINADNYELISTLSKTPGQLNMYGYCNNNPIMFTDETGELAISLTLLGFIFGAVVGGTLAGINAVNNNVSGWNLVGEIFGGALIGGAIGAALGAFVGPGLSFAGGAVAISATGTQALAAVGAASIVGAGVIFATTSKSGGYWAQKYSNDHLPEHVHLKGTDGTNIRIGRDGKTLNGEILTAQQRKALRRLWKQIISLFN